MFGFNINMGFDVQEVLLEVYIEDRVVQRQRMQAPKEMLMVNFVQLAEQIKNDRRPMKIKMTRQETIWDNFEQRQRALNNEIEISNNAMISWEASKGG